MSPHRAAVPSEFGVTFTNGGGGQTPTAGFSLEGNISNARHLCDLGGPFGYAGGSVGPFSGDVSGGPS
ncbi:MAG TPA: hypothetical protein VHU90_02315, partial [Galbitalea sp.]|nr:hypothetical protein [Galbitalea sp.]